MHNIMNNSLKMLVGRAIGHGGVSAAKKLWYGRRGEPYRCAGHLLHYVPGTRPVRLKYANSPIGTVRNDVKQVQYFIGRVRTGEFLLDIGANVGQYAILFAALAGRSGRVIAFEPDSSSQHTLHRNLALNGFARRVAVEDIALFDENSTHIFLSPGGTDATASLMPSGFRGDAQKAQQSIVTTVRLDDYLANRHLPQPDWIKLDVEGAEINVLRGAAQALKSRAIIVCELHPYAWSEFGTSFEELLRLVHDTGRRITYLDESLRIEDGPQYGATIISPAS